MDAGQTVLNGGGAGLQAERLQTLTEISRAVSSTLDLRALYDTIYDQIGRVMDTTQFFIALRRPESDVMDMPYMREDGVPFLDIEVAYGGNVTSLVIEQGAALLFEDDDAYLHYAESHGLPKRSVGNDHSEAKIIVPLHTGSRTIGALSVQSTRQHAYSQDDVQTLVIIAAQAAVAIENARLYAAQERRVIELQTIQSIVHKLTPLHDIPSIVRVIDTELRGLIEYHACRMFLLDVETNVLRPIFNDNHGLQLQVGEGIAGWIAGHGRSQIVSNALDDDRALQIPGTPRHDESILGAPLFRGDHVRGVITLSQFGVGQFDDNALRILEIIAAQAALAFDRVWLYEKLRLEAITDALTKLHNRRFLLERLKEEQSRASRYETSLAAIMFDIDKFKGVNDNYGHDAGDAVLVHIADILRYSLRTEDVVARYGGEEFCILLPDATLDGAMQAAERLREQVAGHPLPPEAGISSVTVSVGMSFHRPGESGTALLNRADHAQYQAKHHGGNAVWINDEENGLYPSSCLYVATESGEGIDEVG